MDYIYVNGELYHHGIKGQKWGVRRWQNADGTYNEAGKKRYGYEDKKAEAIRSLKSKAKEVGGKLAKKAIEAAKEKAKEAINEARQSSQQSDDAREKLRKRLDDLSWNDKISSAQRERMEKELDDMSDDEVRALRKEINRQQASERAKEYLKDYQFKSTKDVMDSDTSDGERSAKRIIDDFEDSISNSSDFKFDTSYKSWFDDDDD